MKNTAKKTAKREIYLDNGATTKADIAVAKEINKVMTSLYGNPSSLHYKGEEAKRILENARRIIAKRINAEPEEIIFTSGGTESDNLAIKGIASAKRKEGKNCIITSPIEHPAIHGTCNFLKNNYGFEILYARVNREGIIELPYLEKLIGQHANKIAVVTIMHANNEVGTIQPIREIGAVCKKYNVIFHTDAVQGFTKAPIDVKGLKVDALSMSSHKIHGPKGVGALFVRKGIKLEKQLHGGHQELDKRAGTENVAGIAGFAMAVQTAKVSDIKKIKKLRDRLINGLLKIRDAKLNGSLKYRLCNNINVSFKGVEGESLLLYLSERGICVSTGSACSSQSLKPSHVLLAIGLSPADAHSSIRLTLSRYNTKQEIDCTIKTIKDAVHKLRKISGYRGKGG